MSKLTSWAITIALVLAAAASYITYGDHVIAFVNNFGEPKIKEVMTYTDVDTNYTCKQPIKVQREWKNVEYKTGSRYEYVYLPVISGDAAQLCYVTRGK